MAKICKFLYVVNTIRKHGPKKYNLTGLKSKKKTVRNDPNVPEMAF